MVKVDNVNIPTYPLDTAETIGRRVAISKKTLPEFLVFSQPPEPRAENVTTTNLLDLARESGPSFNEWVDRVTPIFPSVPRDDLARIYLSYTRVFEQAGDAARFMIIGIQEEFNEKGIKITVKSFPQREKDTFLKSIQQKLQKYIKEEQDWTTINTSFNRIEPLEATSFVYDKVRIWYPTNIRNVITEEIFDDLRSNYEVPFATMKNIYKMSESFINPPEDWRISLDVLVLKVLKPGLVAPLSDSREKIADSYYDFYIKEKEDGETSQIYIGVEARLDSVEMDVTLSISRVKSALKKFRDFEIGEQEFERVEGSFLIPGVEFDKFVYSDMVMLNPVFDYYLTNDEKQKASTERSVVFTKFFDPSNPALATSSLSVGGKRVVSNDPDLVTVDKKSFPIGSPYVKVKILRAINLDAVNHIIYICRRLFAIYQKSRKDIIKFYRAFIPRFAEEVVEDISEKSMEKYLAGDLFVPNYTRTCLKKPRLIVDAEEADALEEEGIQTIQFPRTEAEGTQYYYTCDQHSDYPYIGLRENILDNKDRYPYVPCCFKKDQKNKKKSLYRTYYLGEELEESGVQQRILTTNKFAPLNKFGYLPKNVESMLEIFDRTYEYLRVGVSDSKSSFLECILNIAKPEILEMEEAERVEFVNRERRDLVNNLLLILKQSNYSESIPEIAENLENPDFYLDPQKFSQFFSRHYNINIFLMKRGEEESEVSYVLPDFKWMLFTPEIDSDRYIIVYEHSGNESDNARYPRCELVIRWTKGVASSVEYEYNRYENIVNGLKRVYRNIYSNFQAALCDPIQSINVFFGPGIYIVKQYIDEYGKVRGLRLSYDKKRTISVTCEPLPIFEEVEPVEKDSLFEGLLSAEELQSFVSRIGATIVAQMEISSGVVEVVFEKDDNAYHTLIDEEIDGITSQYNRNIPLGFSVVETYNNLRKAAVYLEGLTRWAYSRSLGETAPSIERAIAWGRDNILVEDIENYRFSPRYGEKNSFWNGSRVIVDDIETKRRLLYMLAMFSRRVPETVKNARKNMFCNDYYTSVLDYRRIRGTSIFTSTKVFDQQDNDYRIYTQVQINKTSPYYFQSPLVFGGEIVMLFPAKSIKRALEISALKISSNVVNEDAEVPSIPEYNLYLYQKASDIKVSKVGDADRKAPAALLYKKEGKLCIMSVLKICS